MAGVVVGALLAVLGTRYVSSDGIPFLTDITPGKFGPLWPRRVRVLIHVAGGSLALFVGLFQFWSGAMAPRVHRWTGRLCALVTFRASAELGVLSGPGPEPVATLIWLSWSMPLLATEVILQGRKMSSSE